MDAENDRCVKCGGEMEAGFLLDRTFLGEGGKPLLWVEGSQIGLNVRARPGDAGQIEVDALRCQGCGYLEFYAGLGRQGS